MKLKHIKISLLICIVLFATNILYSARIKDIANVEGVTGIQVIGYGLVTGLNNTGDNQMNSFTVQSVSNMLKRFGLTIPQTNPRIRNVAAVMVTATIPSFSKRGSKIDVQVSSIGDANSLQGGILLMTPIATQTGEIVGMAQGAVSVGGYDYQALGSRVSRNFVTSGRIPNGLILEKAIDSEFFANQMIRIVLREPDFTTSDRVAEAINKISGLENSAFAIDAGTIQVKLPASLKEGELIQYISKIEAQTIVTDPTSKIVINERTGTVVIGGNVQLLPAVVAHGGLEITIQKQYIVPQPAPFTIRPPRPVATAEINTNEQFNPSIPLVVQGATVQDIANALNALKVSPRDLIAIFQALKEAGSIQGELIIQ